MNNSLEWNEETGCRHGLAQMASQMVEENVCGGQSEVCACERKRYDGDDMRTSLRQLVGEALTIGGQEEARREEDKLDCGAADSSMVR